MLKNKNKNNFNQIGGVVTEDLFYNINPFGEHESKHFLNLFYGYFLGDLNKNLEPKNSMFKGIYKYSALNNSIKKNYKYEDTSYSKIYSILFNINEADEFEISNNYQKISLNNWSNFILITYLLNKLVADIYLNDNIDSYIPIFIECNNINKILKKKSKKVKSQRNKSRRNKSNLQSAMVVHNGSQSHNMTRRNIPTQATLSNTSRRQSRGQARRQNSNIELELNDEEKAKLKTHIEKKNFKLKDIYSTCKTFILKIINSVYGSTGLTRHLEPIIREYKEILFYYLRLTKEDPSLKKIYNYDLNIIDGRIEDREKILELLSGEMILCSQFFLYCVSPNIVNNQDKYNFYNNMFIITNLLKNKLENKGNLDNYESLNEFIKIFLREDNYEGSELNLFNLNGSILNTNFISKANFRLNYKYNDKYKKTEKTENNFYVSIYNLLKLGKWNPTIPADKYVQVIKPKNQNSENNKNKLIEFMNCGEKVSRTVISILIADENYKHDISILESLKASEDLINYFKKYKSMDSLNNKKADNEWAQLISNLTGLKYYRNDYCELIIEENGINFFNLFKKLFNLSDEEYVGKKISDFLENYSDKFNLSEVKKIGKHNDTLFTKFESKFEIKLINGHAKFDIIKNNLNTSENYNFKNNEDIKNLLEFYDIFKVRYPTLNTYYKCLFIHPRVNNYHKNIEISNYLIRNNTNLDTRAYKVDKYYLNIDLGKDQSNNKAKTLIIYNNCGPQNLKDLRFIEIIKFYITNKLQNSEIENINIDTILPIKVYKLYFEGYYSKMNIINNLKDFIDKNKQVTDLIFNNNKSLNGSYDKYTIELPLIKSIKVYKDFNGNIPIKIKNFKELLESGTTKIFLDDKEQVDEQSILNPNPVNN